MDELDEKYKKQKMLEALNNRGEKVNSARAERQLDLARKRPEMMRGERKPSGSPIFEEIKNDKQGLAVKGGTDKINTMETRKISTPKEVQNKAAIQTGTKKLNRMYEAAKESKDAVSMKRAKNALAEMYKKADKLGMTDFFKKGMKSLPIIGGVASALSTGDVSAAIPVLDVDSLQEKPMSREEIDQIEMTDPMIGRSKQESYNELAGESEDVDQANKLQGYLRKQALLSKIR